MFADVILWRKPAMNIHIICDWIRRGGGSPGHLIQGYSSNRNSASWLRCLGQAARGRDWSLGGAQFAFYAYHKLDFQSIFLYWWRNWHFIHVSLTSHRIFKGYIYIYTLYKAQRLGKDYTAVKVILSKSTFRHNINKLLITTQQKARKIIKAAKNWIFTQPTCQLKNNICNFLDGKVWNICFSKVQLSSICEKFCP